ncbi:CRISPR-associated protein [Anoxybacillus sp. CHMUD]|uniref:CRISPR-associated protein n=1 Tax=Anoxybacillus sp. CHMUD TaxID=2508870 RepID=UPI001490E1EE|nr:CRISPR-associated protein [Anoxybacillus sp. CHMUD]NNU91581.1 CRISPR-associated protein [Anoxybacillus sp. CHMUD]
MYQTIVMTCGVSSLMRTNVFGKRKENLLHKLGMSEGEFSQLLNKHTVSEEIDRAILKWIDEMKLHFKEAKETPNFVSAEYSMMHELQKQGKLGKHPRVELILTNTVGGKIVERLLSALFKEHFSATVGCSYVNIDVTETKQMNRTLGEYMQAVGEKLSQGEPTSTCFAPIGGYKVMTSLGYIVGSFLGYPTAYLHENSQIIHEIPPIPIHLDEGFVQKHIALLRRCQRDIVCIDELSHPEKQVISAYSSIFQQEEGYVYLTPFGEFLFEHEKYKHLLDTKYFATKQVIKMMEGRKKFAVDQLKQFVKKLKYEEGIIFNLQHEKEFEKLDQKRVKFYLYKSSTGGVFRLAYQYDEKEDVLFANYLWFDHAQYEREAAAGIGLYEQHSEFEDITNIIVGHK